MLRKKLNIGKICCRIINTLQIQQKFIAIILQNTVVNLPFFSNLCYIFNSLFQTCEGHHYLDFYNPCLGRYIGLLLAVATPSAHQSYVADLGQPPGTLVLPGSSAGHRTRWQEKKEIRKKNEAVSTVIDMFICGLYLIIVNFLQNFVQFSR